MQTLNPLICSHCKITLKNDPNHDSSYAVHWRLADMNMWESNGVVYCPYDQGLPRSIHHTPPPKCPHTLDHIMTQNDPKLKDAPPPAIAPKTLHRKAITLHQRHNTYRHKLMNGSTTILGYPVVITDEATP